MVMRNGIRVSPTERTCACVRPTQRRKRRIPGRSESAARRHRQQTPAAGDVGNRLRHGFFFGGVEYGGRGGIVYENVPNAEVVVEKREITAQKYGVATQTRVLTKRCVAEIQRRKDPARKARGEL